MQLLESEESETFRFLWNQRFEEGEAAFRKLTDRVEDIIRDDAATTGPIDFIFEDVTEILKIIQAFWSARQSLISELHAEAFIKRRKQFHKETLCCHLNSKYCELLRRLPRPITRSNILRMLDHRLMYIREQCIDEIFSLMRKFLMSCLDFTILPDRIFPHQSSPSCYNIGTMELVYNLKFAKDKADKDASFHFNVGPDAWDFQFYFFESDDTARDLLSYRVDAERAEKMFLNPGVQLNGVGIKPKRIATARRRNDGGPSREANPPKDTLYLRFDAESENGKFKHQEEVKIEDSDQVKAFVADGRQKSGKRKIENQSSENAVVAKRFLHFVVSVDIDAKDVQYGRDERHTKSFGVVKAYVFAPESRAMSHTKQGGIDSDGYLLFKSAFGTLEGEKSVEEIVDKMLIPRYEAILQISAEEAEAKNETLPETGALVKVCSQERQSMLIALQRILNPLTLSSSNPSGPHFCSDDLMKSMVFERKRPWDWFKEICNCIQLQNCHRDNNKTRRAIEHENLAALLLNGYMTAFMTKDEAELILSEQEPNTFLLRMSQSSLECKVLLSLKVNEEVRLWKQWEKPYTHIYITFESSQSRPIVTRLMDQLRIEKLGVVSHVLRRVGANDEGNHVWSKENSESLNRFCKLNLKEVEETYHESESQLCALVQANASLYPSSYADASPSSNSVTSAVFMPNTCTSSHIVGMHNSNCFTDEFVIQSMSLSPDDNGEQLELDTGNASLPASLNIFEEYLPPISSLLSPEVSDGSMIISHQNI